MSIKKLLLSAGVLAVICGGAITGAQVNAAAKFDSSDASYVKAGETVDGSTYLAGNSVRMEGTVNGDLYCGGQTVVINGTVNGDVLCAAATLTLNGKVTGDVRLAGSSVTVGADVQGSATIYGGTVTLESSAKIARDATLGGGDVLVNGAVGRDIIGTAQTGTLNGAVGRDVEGGYETLVIGKDATVAGMLHYASRKDASISGKVTGDVKRFEMAEYNGRRADGLGIMAGFLMKAVWVLATALALLLLLPKKMRTVTNLTKQQALLATAIGFMALFAFPILAVLLAITIVGIPLALAVLAIWFTMLVVSVGVTAIYAGRVIASRQPMHIVAATMLGAAVLVIALMIPVLNIIAFVLAVSFGMGAMLYAIRGEYEKTPTPKVRLAKGGRA